MSGKVGLGINNVNDTVSRGTGMSGIYLFNVYVRRAPLTLTLVLTTGLITIFILVISVIG